MYESWLARGAQAVLTRYVHGSVQEDERVRHGRTGGALMVLGALSGVGLLPILPARVDGSLVLLLAGGCFLLGVVIPWLPWDRWPRWALLLPVSVTLPVVFGGGGIVDDALDFYALFLPLVFIYLGLVFPLVYCVGVFAVCIVGLVLAVAVGDSAEYVPFVLLGTFLSVVAGVVLGMQRRAEAHGYDAMRALAEAATMLGAATDRREVADVVAGASHDLFAADDVEVLVLGDALEGTGEHAAVTARRGRAAWVDADDGGALGRTLEVLATLAADGTEPTAAGGSPSASDPSRLVVVIPGPSGPRGAVVVEQRRRARASDRFAIRSLDVLAREAGHVLHRIRRTEQLETSSRTDALTGVSNRAVLQEALDASTAGDVLIIMDLDHFKRINDTLGHATGDQVLVAFAGVLRGAARVNQVVARYGGEEFVTVLPGADDRAVDRHLDDVRRAWAGTNPDVTFSSGIAVRGEAEDPAATMARADQALYLAKSGGRNRDVHAAGERLDEVRTLARPAP